MKKAITILTICLFTFATMQTTQAQTKEETIAWIKEKLEKYGRGKGAHHDYYVSDIHITECSITFTVKLQGNDKYYRTETFPIAANWRASYSGITTNTEVIEYEKVSWGKYYSGTSRTVGLEDREDNLYERMVKALNHLATLNSCEKEEEAF
ncbi:MAG TPA: hypothetical protein VFM65_05730 [Flavobacteriaceae bacterium]|nr:hypothetical protein [Flavobacteriaceae bacterium]